MTPETQRIAIAEARGWKRCNTGDGCWISPTGKHQTLHGTGGTDFLPDYPNDLNAMHETEKVLTITQYDTFALHLNRLCNESRVLSASAAQRAEAFLRTLGLWRDET